MTDLFGRSEYAQPRPKRKRRDPIPNGHAWTPGTGPDGKTCKTCNHCYANRQSKTYYKCWLTRSKWTGGRATDIRLNDAACKFWEKEE